MPEKKGNPNAGNLTREKRHQPRGRRQAETKPATDRSFSSPPPKNQQPTCGGKEESEAVSAARDVINRGAVDWVHAPKKRDEEGGQRDPLQAFLRPVTDGQGNITKPE